MIDWYETLTGIQKMYIVVGSVGSILFLFQFVLMLIGGDADADADVPIDISTDIEMATDLAEANMASMGTEVDSVHADSDVGFKLLSLQSFSVFFMMFGLVGLAFSKGGKYDNGISLLAGFVVGFIFMYLVAKMFAFFKTLQNSGTLDLKNGVGQEARVYLTITPEQAGQVEVVIQGHLKIFPAMSEDSSTIVTDTRVRVVKVVNNIMVVEKLNP